MDDQTPNPTTRMDAPIRRTAADAATARARRRPPGAAAAAAATPQPAGPAVADAPRRRARGRIVESSSASSSWRSGCGSSPTTTLGLDMPGIRWSELWPVMLIVHRRRGRARGDAARPRADGGGPPPGPRATAPPTDRLWLADWRRRIGHPLRRGPRHGRDGPGVALAHWRAVREQLYRDHPQSPVPVADRATFTARHFDHDPRAPVRGVVEPAPPPAPGALRPRAAEQRRRHASRSAASERCPCRSPTAPRSLSVFWMAGYAGGIFVPFRDATNGTETYGAGRYLLDAAKSADLGRRPGGRHPRPRLQLRVPAVVRVRPALGVPAGAAREPARRPDPRRRAPRLTAAGPSAPAPGDRCLAYHRHDDPE